MSPTTIQGGTLPHVDALERFRFSPETIGTFALGLALCAAPVSIAISESLLAVALLIRLVTMLRKRAPLRLPQLFWVWLIWAALEVAIWLHAPNRMAGLGEMRHLLLVAALFLTLPALGQPSIAVTIWRGIFLSATLSSVILIGDFISRLVRFGHQISQAGDPSFYLRSGGLVNHWMIYATLEVMVFAGLLEFWHFYPEERRHVLPLASLNGLAIFLSLTRMLWFCCLLLLVLHLAWRRSKWIWAVPALPLLLVILAPGPVRFRVTGALRPSYYSNAERIQMLAVGSRMILDQPLTGVGPGRVEALYRHYLRPGDSVPAYHGHLHNNLFHLAAEFGIPVTLAAALFTALLFRRLKNHLRLARDRERQFLGRSALLGLTGFLVAGMFDYTYGHSLGLILLGFVAIAPLTFTAPETIAPRKACDLLDRTVGGLLFAISGLLLIPAAIVTRVLSRRSPFIAHLRIGKDGQIFWMWKLRTMWTSAPPKEEETGWVQRIECDAPKETKQRQDPRVTSRFAQFCRRHSIDELPQFSHVMRGQMSLVGPRPLTQGELIQHYGILAKEILAMKPGLTGYWQTRGRSRLSYAERAALDLQLVRDLSTRVYLRVLLRTVPEVLSGKNAW
jgi:exopolysaccharide production protein ExoY